MKAVLIVDDEFALVETLKDFLEHAGYRVDTASNGKEGLEAMRAHRPDLVLTDLMMPIMGGKEMLTAMRCDPQLASVHVVLMSAARQQVAIPPGETFPVFSAFLRKPFRLQPLLDTIVPLIGSGG
jgi:two-component system, chemotaxis family, chemotaxis protein CheY